MQNSAFLRVISPTKEIAVTSDNDDELAVLTREIADKVTYVHSQTILIEVLKRDGHDVSDYERASQRAVGLGNTDREAV